MPEPIDRKKIHEDLADSLDELGKLILEPIISRVPRKVAEFVGGFVMLALGVAIVVVGYLIILISTYAAESWGVL